MADSETGDPTALPGSPTKLTESRANILTSAAQLAKTSAKAASKAVTGNEYDDTLPFSNGANKGQNVMVAVRCRPPLRNEIESGNTFKKLIVDGQSKQVSAWNERTGGYKNSKFNIVLD